MPPSKNMRILVVDDFKTMRRIIIGILKKLGYTKVAEAEDGVQALSVLDSGLFDLVISDWNMPNMTGIDLLKTVRSDERFTGLPFIMVTAEAQQDNIIEAVQAGVTNYIVKPFTPETLEMKIDKAVG